MAMTVQEMRGQIRKLLKQLGKLKQNSKFLFSCISEGVIPKGLKLGFNLANYVNNRDLVENIQKIMNDSNSRILDALYQQNIIKEEEIVNRIEAMEESNN